MMKPAWAVLFLSLCVSCSTPASRTERYPLPDNPEAGKIGDMQRIVSPMNSVEEGVYYFSTGFSTLILELREGRFRYWFWSDVKGLPEPSYPVTGKYLARGPTVQLLHNEVTLQDVWTFRKIDVITTMWRPNALKWWHEKRCYDGYGVLYPTERKPEDVWRNPELKYEP